MSEPVTRIVPTVYMSMRKGGRSEKKKIKINKATSIPTVLYGSVVSVAARDNRIRQILDWMTAYEIVYRYYCVYD